MSTSHYSVKELIYGWVMKLDRIGGGKHKELVERKNNFVGFMFHIVLFSYLYLIFSYFFTFIGQRGREEERREGETGVRRGIGRTIVQEQKHKILMLHG